MKKRSLVSAFAWAVFVLLFITNCEAQDKEVKTDTAFTNLFQRDGDGFTGGDGTYSVLLPDGRTVWIFGDTFLGTVNPDGTRLKTDPMYIRNSFVVQDGKEMTTLYTGSPDNSRSLVIPPEVLASNGEITEDSVWFWPGDAFIEDGMLKLFVSKFKQTKTGMWGFEWAGTSLVHFSLPELEQTNIMELPAEQTKGVHFGHAIFEATNYTYIYGLMDGFPYGARAPKGEVEAPWEYYSGGEWMNNPDTLSPVLDNNISEQFSVIKLDETFYLVSQLGGFSNEIWAFKSDTPYKWESDKGKHLHTVSLPFDNPELFTYNAVVHPQFTDEQPSILISYNTNSHRLQDHFDNALIYRPRFFRVPLSDFR